MKHPFRSDFYTVVTEAGVSVTFKPTNSIYCFAGSALPTTLRVLALSYSQASNTRDAIPKTTPPMKFKTWRSVSRQSSSLQFVSKSDTHLRVFITQQPTTLRDLFRLEASDPQNSAVTLRRSVSRQKSPRLFG